MTLKYESEILFDLMKRDGDDNPSSVLPYESELKEKYLQQVEGAYPKLQDYRSEWLNYNLNAHLPADFPVETVSNVTNATFENVVPYEYRSAILKGSTKYRDIDTGDVLDTFDETKNLELVSVKIPVLTTTGKNLVNPNTLITGTIENPSSTNHKHTPYIKIEPNTSYSIRLSDYIYWYDENKESIGGRVAGFIEEYGRLTSPINAKYVRIEIYDGILEKYNTDWTGVSIIKSTINAYEPYKSNILTVNEDVTLRGIGDVKDELNLLTGEVVERIGEIVLDGSQTLQPHSTAQGDTLMIKISDPSISFKQNSNLQESWDFSDMICDKELIAETPKWSVNEWNEGYNIALISSALSYTYDINSFVLAIRKSYFNVQSIDEFKTWLTQNPLTIRYKLAKESIKTVDLSCINEQGESVTFRPIEGTMHVNTSSQTLPPLLDMSVPVEATTQNLMSFANIVEEE